MTVDNVGNIFIADRDNACVRKVDTNGIITTIAGNGIHGYSGDNGLAINANLSSPSDVAVDDKGNLFIAEYGGKRIRKIDPYGIITTIAGNGKWGYSGDNGPATSAQVNYPAGIDVDHSGNLYIAVTNDNRIRKVDSNGIITTVVGDGISGFSGDNGPALNARINFIWGVTVDSEGDLLIADTYNNRIRKVSKTFTSQKEGVVFVQDYQYYFTFNKAGQHLQTLDINTQKPIATFQYDANNNLISSSDQFGNTITIDRDAGGIPTSIISPYGHRTELVIDSDGNLTDIIYEDGTGYSFEYTSDGLMTSMTNPRGFMSTHAFDDTGRVVSTTDPEFGMWKLDRVIHDDGAVEYSITSSENNTISHLDIKEPGDILRSVTTNPSGEMSIFVGKNQSLEDTENFCQMTNEVKYTIDDKSYLKIPETITITTPGGLERQAIISKSYNEDVNGLTLTATNISALNGKQLTEFIDYQTGEITLTSPEGRIVSAAFDINNLLLTDKQIDGFFNTHFDYDFRGRLSAITSGDRSTVYQYDARGNIESIEDPLFGTTYFPEYDLRGRLKKEIRSDNSVIEYSYDENGNMTIYRTPQMADNAFGYNGVNRRSSFTTHLGSVTTYSYDKERKLKSITLPSKKQIVNNYLYSRLKETITSEWTNVYKYNCGNNIDTITRGLEVLDYDYDGTLVSRISQTGTLNRFIGINYNDDFLINELTYAGYTESLDYDNDGLLTSSGAFNIGRTPENGLPVTVSDSVFTLTRGFNGYGEIDSTKIDIIGSVYAYDLVRHPSGRIKTKTETIQGVSSTFLYSYDNIGRLLTVTKDGNLVEEYTYDDNGNRVYQLNAYLGIAGRNFSHSLEDHTINAGPITYEFDYDDHLAARIVGAETTEYLYSSTGELMQVTLPDTTVVSYNHDPLGRRIAKKINGTITEKYLWSGRTTLLAVYDGNDRLLQRFEYADGRMPYAMTAGNEKYYLGYDQVGSLRIITDNAGNIVKQIDYDSFGNIINDTNPNFSIPFGFAGGLHDRVTGLVRFGFRDYLPEIGKWTAKDPIDFAAGDSNLYGYVENDPINLTDPQGLFVFLPQAIGATINLAFEGYRQYQSQDFDMGRLAMAAATGALGGFGTSIAKAMLFGATANMLNTAYQQTEDPCQSLDMGNVFRSGLWGAGGGAIGYAGGVIGRSSFRPTKTIGQEIGNMPAHHSGASGSAIGAAIGGTFANQ